MEGALINKAFGRRNYKRTEVYTQRFFEDTKDLILMGNLEPNYSDVHIFFNKINIGRQLDVSKS
ncbi:hypothetical protein bpr_II347 (plasmid) [Butyrivibrio proteoclasticus B316]|uniref:Uncharacterized protein n=1 Tax=Butyrivibrio proteoclasticus (strain ATCC 51982 / DSM 14932 / B316) TaxID=515622 RepID=E0S4F2_BUTPB|nr:hypothetical protein [Butyrivibrio proteoclasticus]ADL36284.1 hypothetical protein bpr_II347 [Butyrivibrio proteoclasticus B316]